MTWPDQRQAIGEPTHELLFVRDDPEEHEVVDALGLVRWVKSTSDALADLPWCPFLSIVVDLERCKMDALELTRSIRRRWRCTIDFIVGPDCDQGAIRSLSKLDSVDFVSRDVAGEVLLRRVARHLALAKAQEAARDQLEQRRALADLFAALLTEKERIGVDLADLNRYLDEAYRAKDELLGMLGHELRNPLASLTLAAKLLSERPIADPIVRRAGETMGRQVARLNGLVDDILDLSRLQSSEACLERRVIDLRTVVERALEDDRVRDFQCELADEPVPILGDQDRLSAQLAKLLQNAGGACCQIEDGYAVVRVVGRIPTSPPNGMPSGDDFGLVALRRLTELHSGRISVKGDEGDCVELRFPLGPSSAQTSTENIGEPKRVRRVAIIEDNLDARELLSEIIAAEGHEVMVAADGVSGLELLLTSRPDVALVDIGLPGLDGYEVAKEIRTAQQPIRLIALSGLGRESDRARAFAAGFDFHVTKPPKLTALMDLLKAS